MSTKSPKGGAPTASLAQDANFRNTNYSMVNSGQKDKRIFAARRINDARSKNSSVVLGE
jgi:hypothetical protein